MHVTCITCHDIYNRLQLLHIYYMDLKQEFIYCGVCYRGFEEDECGLYLTSCAHICCNQHILTNNLQETTCPICHSYVSAMKIDDELPPEISSFLTPFSKHFALMASQSTFQFCALNRKLDHYKKDNHRLLQKIKVQKQLIEVANNDLSRAKKYRQEAMALRNEVEGLKSHLDEISSGGSLVKHKIQKLNPAISKSFLDQVKRLSLQSMTPHKVYRDHNEPGELSFFGESTKIEDFSPKRKVLAPLNQNIAKLTSIQVARKVPILQPANRPSSLLHGSPLRTRSPFLK